MTKLQAVEIFKNEILPDIKRVEEEYTNKDVPLRNVEWGYFIDMLCKEGYITESQYNRWSTPSICK